MPKGDFYEVMSVSSTKGHSWTHLHSQIFVDQFGSDQPFI